MYFADGQWLRVEEDALSSASSLGISLPDTNYDNVISDRSVTSVDSEESIFFLDFSSNELHEPGMSVKCKTVVLIRYACMTTFLTN